MRLGLIYCLTNLVTGKMYVGQTVKTLERRWTFHVSVSQHKANTLIARSIKKYGEQRFTRQILEANVCENDLDAREIFWIAKLDTQAPRGYNLTRGGRGTFVTSCSIETRKKISIANSFKLPSPETRQKLSDAGKRQAHPQQTVCRNGHPFNEENTFIYKKTVSQLCLTCYYTRTKRHLPKRLEKYLQQQGTGNFVR